MTPKWPLLLCSILLSLSAPAFAKRKKAKSSDKADIATIEAKARAAYRAGDFQTAADAFGALLIRLPAEDRARARTQYNRGRALQQAGRACAAAEALFGYMSNPQSKIAREARRRTKAETNLAEARAECEQRADPDEPAPAPIIEAPVEPAPKSAGTVLLEAGLGSGLYLTGGTERARTTVFAGGGWARDAWVFDLIAEFAIETPEGADTLAMIRPGLRYAVGETTYLRAGLPLLLAPLTALGVNGGVGMTWPKDSSVAAFGEVGGLAWFSSPVQLTLEARLGVQASF